MGDDVTTTATKETTTMNTINGTSNAAATYENDPDTLLEVWLASRERVVEALKAKRDGLAKRLAEAERQLAEVVGVEVFRPAPSRQRKPYGRRGAKRDAICSFLASNPGSTGAAVAKATGANAANLYLMAAKGTVHKSLSPTGAVVWSLSALPLAAE